MPRRRPERHASAPQRCLPSTRLRRIPRPPQKKSKPPRLPFWIRLHPDALPTTELREPVVHLDIPPAPISEKPPEPLPPQHSLRKHELPLAPAPAVTHKTALPTGRHDEKDIAEIRRRDALQNLSSHAPDPAAHLKKITAGFFLLIPAYLFALAAGFAAWKRVHHITPLSLLAVASIFAIFIFIRKKRSRHHAAFLAIIIILTLVFGGLHYAPVFNYAP